MSITKRPNGKYRLDCKIRKDGEIYRFSQVVSTKAEAKQLEIDFRYKVVNEISFTKLTPFNRYGRQYLDLLNGVTFRTKHTYEQKFSYVSKLMTKPINKYKNSDIKKLMKVFIDQGLSPRSVKHIHSIVKRIFSQATLDFQIPQPCGTFKQDTSIVVESHKQNKALSKEEQNRFLTYLKTKKNDKYFTHQEYIFGLLAFSTGMRRGEMTPLEWTDFDLDAKTVKINKAVSYASGRTEIGNPKTKSGIREIQLDDFLVSQIKAYRGYLIQYYLFKEKFEGGWFFPYLDNSETMTPITSWSQRMKKVFKSCDIANSLHGLRHTHASNMLMTGYPLIQLANRLGHKDSEITSRVYGHMIQDDAIDITQYLPTMDISNDL